MGGGEGGRYRGPRRRAWRAVKGRGGKKEVGGRREVGREGEGGGEIT